MRKTVIMLAILAICMYTTLLHAAPPLSPALPSGAIYSVSGESLQIETIGKDNAVLLLLIKKGSPGGEKLLTTVENLKNPFPADSLLVIVEGADDKLLNAMAKRHNKLAAAWYRDTDSLLSKGLQLKTTPATMGIIEAKAAWMMFGVADPEKLEKTARGWLNR